jgi:hypothetical protein
MSISSASTFHSPYTYIHKTTMRRMDIAFGKFLQLPKLSENKTKRKTHIKEIHVFWVYYWELFPNFCLTWVAFPKP